MYESVTIAPTRGALGPIGDLEHRTLAATAKGVGSRTVPIGISWTVSSRSGRVSPICSCSLAQPSDSAATSRFCSRPLVLPDRRHFLVRPCEPGSGADMHGLGLILLSEGADIKRGLSPDRQQGPECRHNAQCKARRWVGFANVPDTPLVAKAFPTTGPCRPERGPTRRITRGVSFRPLPVSRQTHRIPGLLAAKAHAATSPATPASYPQIGVSIPRSAIHCRKRTVAPTVETTRPTWAGSGNESADRASSALLSRGTGPGCRHGANLNSPCTFRDPRAVPLSSRLGRIPCSSAATDVASTARVRKTALARRPTAVGRKGWPEQNRGRAARSDVAAPLAIGRAIGLVRPAGNPVSDHSENFTPQPDDTSRESTPEHEAGFPPPANKVN